MGFDLPNKMISVQQLSQNKCWDYVELLLWEEGDETSKVFIGTSSCVLGCRYDCWDFARGVRQVTRRREILYGETGAEHSLWRFRTQKDYLNEAFSSPSVQSVRIWIRSERAWNSGVNLREKRHIPWGWYRVLAAMREVRSFGLTEFQIGVRESSHS